MAFYVDFQTTYFNVAVTGSETPASFRIFDGTQQVDVIEQQDNYGGATLWRDQQVAPAESGEITLWLEVEGLAYRYGSGAEINLHGYDSSNNPISDTLGPLSAGDSLIESSLSFASLTNITSNWDTDILEWDTTGFRIFQTKLGAISQSGPYVLWGPKSAGSPETSGMIYLQVGSDTNSGTFTITSDFDGANYQGVIGDPSDREDYRGSVIVVSAEGTLEIDGVASYKTLYTYCDDGHNNTYGSINIDNSGVEGLIKVFKGTIQDTTFYGNEKPATLGGGYPTPPTWSQLTVGSTSLDGTDQIVTLDTVQFLNVDSANVRPKAAIAVHPLATSTISIDNITFTDTDTAIQDTDTEAMQVFGHCDYSGINGELIDYGNGGRGYYKFVAPTPNNIDDDLDGILARSGANVDTAWHGYILFAADLTINAKKVLPDVSTWLTCGTKKELAEIDLTGATIRLYDANGNSAFRGATDVYWTGSYINESATTITVSGDTSIFSPNDYAWLDYELVRVREDWPGGSPLTVYRNQCGTGAQYHNGIGITNKYIYPLSSSESLPAGTPLVKEIIWAWRNVDRYELQDEMANLNDFTLVVIIKGFYPYYAYVTITDDTEIECVMAPLPNLFDSLPG